MRKTIGLAVAFAASAALASAQTTGAFEFEFANGDRLTGSLLELADGKLRLAPDLVPASPLVVPYAQVVSIGRPAAPDGAAPAGPAASAPDFLELRSGDVLAGRLLSLSASAVSFETTNMGALNLPASAVALFRRTDSAVSWSEPASAYFSIATKRGARLVGRIESGGADSLMLASDEFTTKVALSGIDYVVFPDPQAAAPAAADADPYAFVSLRDGSGLTGKKVVVKADKLAMLLSGTIPVSVPLAAVSSIEAIDSPSVVSASRQVLVWGRYGDEGEEVAHTVAALENQLGKGWKVATDMSDDYSGVSKKALGRARALVVAEPENWDYDAADRFREHLKNVVLPYVKAGGNLVVLSPSSEQLGLYEEVGLIGASDDDSDDSATLGFSSEGKRFERLAGVSSFETANATKFYGSMDGNVNFADTEDRGTTPLFGRKVGRGWVVVFGADFYESNEGMDKVLAASARFE